MTKSDPGTVTLSAAEIKRIREVREQFQREKPARENSIATGEYEGPIKHGVTPQATTTTKESI